MEDLEEFFLNVKPVKTLIALNDPGTGNYASAISKKTDSTYSHTVRILNRMEESGLVTSEKKGRKKELELTDRGHEIAQKLSEALRLMQ
jgi:DNA-binding MarR family transcriptional regulator